MSAFTHGFNHGFFHGMFNRMFGGFGMFNWGGWNSAPSFFTPSYNFGNFFNYQAPMPMMPSLFSISAPNFTTMNQNITWQNFDYTMPNFSTSFDWGDTFVKKETQEKKVKKDSKNYSDSDTSNYTNDATELKNKWNKVNSSLSQEFYNKVVQIANRLNCSADDLMALMNSESGLKHTEVNSIGASGLIQFLPKTAKGLGTTTEDLKAMTPEEQLVYVEKHLSKAKKTAGYKESDKIGAGTLYALVWLPAYANRDILAEKENDPNEYYAKNSGLDMDNDGIISKADLAKRIDAKRA